MSLLEEWDREALSALAAEILTALGEEETAVPASRRETGAAPEMEAETWETLLPLAAQAAARQRDWRAVALRKSAGAEGAGLSRDDGAREAAFLRARQRLSEAVDGMLSSGGPAGTAPARDGETGMARQTGDLPREDRKARREAEAVSRILERGARGYDAGFIHY